MELISYTITTTKKSNAHRIYFVGDAHYGTKSFDVNLFNQTVDFIRADEQGHVILMGDMAECINYDDERFDPRCISQECLPHLADLGRFQVEKVTELLTPIANKIILLMDGNHEETLRTKHQIDFNWRLRDNLNDAGGEVKYGGDICGLRLKFVYVGKGNSRVIRTVKFLISHGYGAGRTKGNKINKLLEMTQIMPNANGFFLAHHHDKVTDRINAFDICEGRSDSLALVEEKKLLGITGSFFKTYEKGQSNYASKKLYRPSDLGAIYAEIKPFYGEQSSKLLMDIRDLIL